MKNTKHLSLRLDYEMHYKLNYIASYDGRSTSNKILQLIKLAIVAFEKKNGKIEVPDEITQGK